MRLMVEASTATKYFSKQNCLANGFQKSGRFQADFSPIIVARADWALNADVSLLQNANGPWCLDPWFDARCYRAHWYWSICRGDFPCQHQYTGPARHSWRWQSMKRCAAPRFSAGFAQSGLMELAMRSAFVFQCLRPGRIVNHARPSAANSNNG